MTKNARRKSSPPEDQFCRRRLLKACLYGGLTLATGQAGLNVIGCSKMESARNIIVVIVDTLRADHLGCHGYARSQSPGIDRLAADSVLFRRAMCTAPWTTASVASILTSQFPSVLGITDRPTRFDQRHPTLPQLLSGKGYRTHGIVSVDMLARNFGFGQGFDEYDEDNYTGREWITSPQVFDKAIAALRRPGTEPFFLFIHTFDPHYNYILHKRWNYYPEYRGSLKSNHPILDLWKRLESLTPDDVRFLVSLYDSEISFTDHHLSRFLDALRNQGLYDDSLIVITADHGEEFMERGWIGHCNSLHREQVHVPLIIKPPGNHSAMVDEPVSLLDLMPTLLHAAGVRAPAGLEGHILDLSRPETIPARPIFSETFNAQRHRPDKKDSIAYRSVILGGRKMIRDEINQTHRLFDTGADPAEKNDLVAQPTELDETLTRLLTDWGKYVQAKRTDETPEDASSLLSPEQLRRLESMGYL